MIWNFIQTWDSLILFSLNCLFDLKNNLILLEREFLINTKEQIVNEENSLIRVYKIHSSVILVILVVIIALIIDNI